MSEKRFIVESVMIDCLCEDEPRIAKVITDKEELYSYDNLYEISDLLNEQQATIEHLTKSRDKWSKSAKLHSEYFDCLEKAIEIAYEEKPYPKIEDIMTIYSKLEKEVNDE